MGASLVCASHVIKVSQIWLRIRSAGTSVVICGSSVPGIAVGGDPDLAPALRRILRPREGGPGEDQRARQPHETAEHGRHCRHRTRVRTSRADGPRSPCTCPSPPRGRYSSSHSRTWSKPAKVWTLPRGWRLEALVEVRLGHRTALAKVLGQIVDGLDGRAEGRAGENGHRDAQLVHLLQGEARRDARLVVEDRPVDFLADAPHLVHARGPLHEREIGARLEIGVGAADRVVEAAPVGAPRVRAGDEHEVGIEVPPDLCRPRGTCPPPPRSGSRAVPPRDRSAWEWPGPRDECPPRRSGCTPAPSG